MNGKYIRGKVDILSLFGVGFLVLTLITIVSVTSNPLKTQLIGTYAKVKKARSCADLGSPSARQACNDAAVVTEEEIVADQAYRNAHKDQYPATDASGNHLSNEQQIQILTSFASTANPTEEQKKDVASICASTSGDCSGDIRNNFALTALDNFYSDNTVIDQVNQAYVAQVAQETASQPQTQSQPASSAPDCLSKCVASGTPTSVCGTICGGNVSNTSVAPDCISKCVANGVSVSTCGSMCSANVNTEVGSTAPASTSPITTPVTQNTTSTSTSLEKTDEGFIRTTTTITRDPSGTIVAAKSVSTTSQTTSTFTQTDAGLVRSDTTVTKEVGTGQIVSTTTSQVTLPKTVAIPTASISINPQGTISIKQPSGTVCAFSSECNSGSCQNVGGSLVKICQAAAPQEPQLQSNAQAVVLAPQYTSKTQCEQDQRSKGVVPGGAGGGYAQCNAYISQSEQLHALDTLTGGAFTPYVQAFQGPAAYQNAGFATSEEYIRDCISKGNPAYGCMRQATNLTPQEVASSVQLGSNVVAEAALVAAPIVSLAEVGTGATLKVLGSKLLLNTLAIQAQSSTGNAVSTCIINPATGECGEAAFLAALSWANVGAIDYVANAAVAGTAQALQNARIVNLGTSGLNAGFAGSQAIDTCFGENYSALGCVLNTAFTAAATYAGAAELKGLTSANRALSTAVEAAAPSEMLFAPQINEISSAKLTGQIILADVKTSARNLIDEQINNLANSRLGNKLLGENIISSPFESPAVIFERGLGSQNISLTVAGQTYFPATMEEAGALAESLTGRSVTIDPVNGVVDFVTPGAAAEIPSFTSAQTLAETEPSLFQRLVKDEKGWLPWLRSPAQPAPSIVSNLDDAEQLAARLGVQTPAQEAANAQMQAQIAFGEKYGRLPTKSELAEFMAVPEPSVNVSPFAEEQASPIVTSKSVQDLPESEVHKNVTQSLTEGKNPVVFDDRGAVVTIDSGAPLGEGGQSTVYSGTYNNGRSVAVKIPKNTSSQAAVEHEFDLYNTLRQDLIQADRPDLLERIFNPYSKASLVQNGALTDGYVMPNTTARSLNDYLAGGNKGFVEKDIQDFRDMMKIWDKKGHSFGDLVPGNFIKENGKWMLIDPAPSELTAPAGLSREISLIDGELPGTIVDSKNINIFTDPNTNQKYALYHVDLNNEKALDNLITTYGIGKATAPAEIVVSPTTWENFSNFLGTSNGRLAVTATAGLIGETLLGNLAVRNAIDKAPNIINSVISWWQNLPFNNSAPPETESVIPVSVIQQPINSQVVTVVPPTQPLSTEVRTTDKIVNSEKLFNGNAKYTEYVSSDLGDIKYHVIRIDPAKANFFVTPSQGRTTTSNFLAFNNLDIAINGDGFDRYTNTLAGFAASEGKPYGQKNVEGTLYIDKNNNISFTEPSPGELWNAISFPNVLVQAGNIVPHPEKIDVNPRTALGITKNGDLILIAVEGVEYQSGVTVQDLSQLLIDQGAVTAVMFDSGSSTTMVIKGPDGSPQVVNNPNGGESQVLNQLGISF